jgi:response regulator RpfG family c-di-GMP phosphodiesterase
MEFTKIFFSDFRFRVDETNLSVRSQQLQARLKLYPGMLLSQILAQAVFVWLMWKVPESSRQYLLIWLGITYLLYLTEFIRWLYFREKIRTIPECNLWSRILFLFALTIGLMWGLGSMYFLPKDLLVQVVLICVMLVLAAGSAAGNTTHLPSLYAYVLGLMVPLIFRVLVEMDEAHFALGSLLLLFMLMLLASGHSIHRLVLISLQQKVENQSLAKQLAAKNNELELKVEERSAQLSFKSEEVSHIRDVTIVAMGILAETRDHETGNHLKRTQNYIFALAKKMSHHPRFKDLLTDEYIEALFKLAPLHDIGKVGIPDYILLKPERLTADELEIMKTHPVIGGDVLTAAESELPAPSRFLHIGHDIASGHHEKWDGSGYPKGLKGNDIPVSARLMAIADVYDALISQRVYKKAFPHEVAVSLIAQGRGTHFDPDLVDAFLEIQEEFRTIAERYQDTSGNESH